MRYVILTIAACLVFSILSFGQETGIRNYRLVRNWPQIDSNVLGQPSGLGTDGRGHIFVFHRAGASPGQGNDVRIKQNAILKLDVNSGELIDSWGRDIFLWPHGLTVDRDGNVWVTDVGLHQIFKFGSTGELLMTLGIPGEPGNDTLHFNRPTDVAVAEDGTFYVSDGYGNSRIIRFYATGKYLLQWGKKGSGEGQFDLPHSITLDHKGNVIVADRENNRLQKFDPEGNFLGQWQNPSNGGIYAVTTDDCNSSLWAVDFLVSKEIALGSDVMMFSPRINFQGQFGRSGAYDGPVCRYHDIAIDGLGNIYVADLLNNLVQKFEPLD